MDSHKVMDSTHGKITHFIREISSKVREMDTEFGKEAKIIKRYIKDII